MSTGFVFLMFEDRRGRGDRRTLNVPGGMSSTNCRRKRERRNILRQYHPQPWWLQTNYVEELYPPTLDSEESASAQKKD